MHIPHRTISFLILNQTPALITHISSELRKKKKKTNLIQQPFLMTEKLVALSQQRIKVNENLSSDQEEMHHGMATLENLQPQTIKPSIV